MENLLFIAEICIQLLRHTVTAAMEIFPHTSVQLRYTQLTSSLRKPLESFLTEATAHNY